jgi:Family of unknown function (DUF5989)
MEKNDSKGASEFARQAGTRRSSFLSDYLFLVKTNRKWWMLPLLGLLLGFGVLMVLASTGAAPFIYTMF